MTGHRFLASEGPGKSNAVHRRVVGRVSRGGSLFKALESLRFHSFAGKKSGIKRESGMDQARDTVTEEVVPSKPVNILGILVCLNLYGIPSCNQCLFFDEFAINPVTNYRKFSKTASKISPNALTPWGAVHCKKSPKLQSLRSTRSMPNFPPKPNRTFGKPCRSLRLRPRPRRPRRRKLGLL